MALTPRQLRELSRVSSERLFGALRRPDSPATIDFKKSSAGDEIAPTQTKLIRSADLKNGLRIIRAQSMHKTPFLFRNEAAHIGGVKGVASLMRAEKALIEAGFIQKRLLPQGRTRRCLWEILDAGYREIGTSPQATKSKGGYLHKFSAHRIAESFKMQGYDVEIEHRRPNGKLVDVLAHKQERTVFVEVCASGSFDKEITNIELDLQAGPFPDELVMAVTERNMSRALAKLIEARLSNYRLPVEPKLALAGDLITPPWSTP